MGTEITIKHRCGMQRTFWVPSTKAGVGYVHVVTASHPGTLGWQPTMPSGETVMSGDSEEQLRHAAWRWIRSQRNEYTCACGEDRGHE